MDVLTENKNENQSKVSSQVAEHWYDSEGAELTEKNDVVRVSDRQVYGEGRTADYGEIVSFNENGTVSVFWDSAGCFCDGAREENPTHLTISTENERNAFHSGVRRGVQQGEENLQADLRELLGIKEPKEKTQENES